MTSTNHGGGRRSGRYQEYRAGGKRRTLAALIPESWHERLDRIANIRGVAKSQLVRSAIRRFLDSHDSSPD